MPKINWTWLLIGLALGWFGPNLFSSLKGATSKA